MTKALDLDGKLIDENKQKLIMGFDPAYTKDVSVMTTIIVDENEKLKVYKMKNVKIIFNGMEYTAEVLTSNFNLKEIHANANVSSKPSWAE